MLGNHLVALVRASVKVGPERASASRRRSASLHHSVRIAADGSGQQVADLEQLSRLHVDVEVLDAVIAMSATLD